MKNYYFIILMLLSSFSHGQIVIDSCFSSANPSTDFISSPFLVNNSLLEGDLMEWTGVNWIGTWPLANIIIPPPSNVVGSRAIFIGNGIEWTGGGEGFCLLLSSPLVAGQTYSFDFTYVSEGFGSDGVFSPFFYTNNTSSLAGAYNVGSFLPAGYTWTSNTITFTATTSQNGHTWIVIHTGITGSSGIIYQLCGSQNVACSINIGNDTILCQGETLTLDVTTPNATYLWQDNSTNPTFNINQQGIYWTEVTLNNCSTSDTILVNYNPLPSFDLGNDTTLCQGETLAIDVTTPNATYLWQDNSTNSTFNINQQGIYWTEVTLNNCSSSDTILVNYSPLTSFDIGNDSTLCQGETLAIDATTPNAIYLWQDDSTNPTFNINQQGTYWVEVTLNDCSTSDTILVNYNPLPSFDIGNDTTLCQGETLAIDATTPNAIYLWQDDSTDPTFNINQQGIYWTEVTLNDCSTSDTILVNYNPLTSFDLGNDTTLCQGETLAIDATTPNATYLWQDNSTSSMFNVTQQGTYWVEVTDRCGLKTDITTIEFKNCNCNLYIPNIFSPNNDNDNDKFSLISNCDFSMYHFMVFTRWGEKIFETSIPEDSWDGTYNGKISSIGVYTYIVKYRFKDKVINEFQFGDVTLIR